MNYITLKVKKTSSSPDTLQVSSFVLSPLSHGGGRCTPPPVVFCPLLKKSSGNPYLKILDFSQILSADTPINFFLSKNFVYILWQNFWDTKYIFFLNFCFYQKIFLQTLDFRYHKFFFGIFGTLYNQKEEKGKFHI